MWIESKKKLFRPIKGPKKYERRNSRLVSRNCRPLARILRFFFFNIDNFDNSTYRTIIDRLQNLPQQWRSLVFFSYPVPFARVWAENHISSSRHKNRNYWIVPRLFTTHALLVFYCGKSHARRFVNKVQLFISEPHRRSFVVKTTKNFLSFRRASHLLRSGVPVRGLFRREYRTAPSGCLYLYEFTMPDEVSDAVRRNVAPQRCILTGTSTRGRRIAPPRRFFFVFSPVIIKDVRLRRFFFADDQVNFSQRGGKKSELSKPNSSKSRSALS